MTLRARRLGVITDAHANRPALAAALAALAREGCDLVVHGGDAIGIGPHPAEVVSDLLAADVVCVMGNHDALFLDGMPDPPPAWMSDGEAANHAWQHAALDDRARRAISRWPDRVAVRVDRLDLAVCHYALAAPRAFAPVVPDAGPGELDRLFADVPGDVVAYGHHHVASDVTSGARRYVNPGSLGCCKAPVARAAVVDAGGVRTLAAPYDSASLLADFDARGVPDRDLLRAAFMPVAPPRRPAASVRGR